VGGKTGRHLSEKGGSVNKRHILIGTKRPNGVDGKLRVKKGEAQKTGTLSTETKNDRGPTF